MIDVLSRKWNSIDSVLLKLHEKSARDIVKGLKKNLGDYFMETHDKSKLPKLYQYAVCPFCCKVKAILKYKGIDYETIEVHPLKKTEISFSKDYRKVPIFISREGEQVNDSTNIMRFIDGQYSKSPVFESEKSLKANEDKWLKWADEVLVRALPPLIYQNFGDALKAFDYITREGKFSWIQQRAVKYTGALAMKMVAKKSAKSQGIANPQEHLEKCLDKWAKAMGSQNFLGGEKPNGADLAVYGILNSIEEMPAFVFVEANSQVFSWYEALTCLIGEVETQAA